MIREKFEDYFQKSGVMKSWFAKQIGISPQVLYFWINGYKPIPKEHWQKIILQSGGTITLSDLMSNFMKDSEEFIVKPGKTPDTCIVTLK